MKKSSGNGFVLSFRTAAIVAISIVIIRLAVLALVKDRMLLLLVDDTIFIIANGLAAACLLYAARRSVGRSRSAWTVLAVAQIANTVGEALWTVIEGGLHQNPFPSLADAGFLIFYPLMFYPLFAVGAFLQPDVPLTSRERLKILLDAGIVIIAATSLFWVFLIAPVIASNEAINLRLALSVAYPVMDLVLFVALMEVLSRKLRSPGKDPLFFIVLSIAVVILTDVIFSVQIRDGTYVSGSLLDTGWLVSRMLLGLAGVLQAGSSPIDSTVNNSTALSVFRNRRTTWAPYLPYLGIGAAAILLVWGYDHSLHVPFSILSGYICVFVGLMAIRQKLTLDENNQLLTTTLAEIDLRKQAEASLQKAHDELDLRVKERTAELESRNAEMERFVYTVSHELRTPLISVGGVVGFLKKDLENEDAQRIETDLRLIGNALTRMDQLLGETLELSRIGRIVNQLEDVSFDEIVSEALDRAGTSIMVRGVNVSVADGLLPLVRVDKMRIVEVLTNLIENSVKYMGDQSDPRIEIGYRSDEGQTIFFVRDNGIGIDPSQHDKVFELFYKVDNKTGGTGAGLAIVKRIIEVHGGKIWIESGLEKGCTVCFTLPLAQG
ncbi:Methanogenesis regulatory histidine kinase FilI [uncultured archaeon]|nr:Methanogenesis regulatory histidine kinase FilI [uncultured archaeon]